MNDGIEKTRSKLADLAALDSQTEEMERKILAGAEQRLSEVDSQLKDLTPSQMMVDEEAAEKYQELVEERGVLYQVILKSRAVLRE